MVTVEDARLRWKASWSWSWLDEVERSHFFISFLFYLLFLAIKMTSSEDVHDVYQLWKLSEDICFKRRVWALTRQPIHILEFHFHYSLLSLRCLYGLLCLSLSSSALDIFPDILNAGKASLSQSQTNHHQFRLGHQCTTQESTSSLPLMYEWGSDVCVDWAVISHILYCTFARMGENVTCSQTKTRRWYTKVPNLNIVILRFHQNCPKNLSATTHKVRDTLCFSKIKLFKYYTLFDIFIVLPSYILFTIGRSRVYVDWDGIWTTPTIPPKKTNNIELIN